MSWIVLIWSLGASASFAFALLHFLIWIRQRHVYTHVLFALASASVGVIALCELVMMHASSPEEYGSALRWAHVPVFVLIVTLTCYVHAAFDAGPVLLMRLVIGLRAMALVANFLGGENMNYREVTSLIAVPLWGGEKVMVAQGIINPWGLVGQLGALLFVVFVLAASVERWRKGRLDERRRVLLVGGSIALFCLLAVVQGILVNQHVIRIPYLVSLPFLIPIVVIAIELSDRVVQTALLARKLEESRASFSELEKRTRLAAEAAELGFWEYDLRDNKLWLSGKSLDFAQVDTPNIADLDRVLDKVMPEDQVLITDAFEHAKRNGGGFAAEVRLVLTGNEVRWISLQGDIEFDSLRTPVRLRGVASDITARRRMEHDISRQRSELTHLARITMLGELSGSLAHELNQPLTAILSNAQAASRFLAQDSCDLQELRAILKDIIDSSKRAGETIRRLRLLFKKGEVEDQIIDLNGLVEEVLRFLNSDLINCLVVVQPRLAVNLASVRGDRVQLQQVLINVLMNACDAMASIDRESRKLVVSTYMDTRGRVAIDVKDCGTGIAPADLERIFDAFVTTKPQGMGMGLAVCRTILSAHGGEIWVTNNPDAGVTFHMVLPAQSVGPT